MITFCGGRTRLFVSHERRAVINLPARPRDIDWPPGIHLSRFRQRVREGPFAASFPFRPRPGPIEDRGVFFFGPSSPGGSRPLSPGTTYAAFPWIDSRTANNNPRPLLPTDPPSVKKIDAGPSGEFAVLKSFRRALAQGVSPPTTSGPALERGGGCGCLSICTDEARHPRFLSGLFRSEVFVPPLGKSLGRSKRITERGSVPAWSTAPRDELP